MASKNLELVDVSTKKQIAKAPLAAIRFLPRTGERIFLPQEGASWRSYTVVSVEYFLGQTARSEATTAGDKIVIYVEETA
jgi:hypothetical protein